MKSTIYSRYDWDQYLNPSQGPDKKLFCFPFAGGSSIVFRKWQEKFPKEIEVIAVELPGRGRRLN